MRQVHGIALTFLLAASPTVAVEPGAVTASLEIEVPFSPSPSETPVVSGTATIFETANVDDKDSPTAAIRHAIQTRLSETFTATSKQKKKAEKGALVEYYSTPDGKLLWVDEKGLTARGKAVIAEIERADDFGLRASDYTLPNMADFDASAPNATEKLAVAELIISDAVIDYAHDARGGRINPRGISENLDPTLSLPKPLEVIESIAYRSDPAAYLRSFQPQHPQFELLRKKLSELRGGSQQEINKILLNMERWRWLPQDRGSFFITVNIPEFTLRVVKDNETIHTARVMVGKTNTQTPIFSDEIETVIFGPYWNVPTSIKVDEIRPYVRPSRTLFGGWNTRVFQQYGLRIKYGGREIHPGSIDWNRVDIRELDLYQPPGPRNVLGRVKFMFPNKHDIYMHDTPQKHLFAKRVRAESHGCIRVQNPDRLAALILKHDKNWSGARTLSAFQTGYDQHVGLNRHVPVYITYVTLRVDDDGSITTFDDLYGHDRRMSATLLGRRAYAEADDGIITQSIPTRIRARPRDPVERLSDF